MMIICRQGMEQYAHPTEMLDDMHTVITCARACSEPGTRTHNDAAAVEVSWFSETHTSQTSSAMRVDVSDLGTRQRTLP